MVKQFQALMTQPQVQKQLLSCQGQDAQELLNLFQWLLDHRDLDKQLSKHIIVLAQRLSVKTGLYPVCYELKNQIEDVKVVGGGAQADIYNGKVQGQFVCIKAMRVFETMDKELVLKQFWKEAILWRQLCHPNILPVYGLYRFQDRPSIVAPWMENGNITRYLKDNPEAPRLPLAVGVARGLSYLHDKGVIHGDLKGSNVLVDDEGIARVADFGISSISDPQILNLTSYSGPASKGGTIRWQAPELFDMQNDTIVHNSKASDVYAWAYVCYEVFTGSIPLDHLHNDVTVLYQVKMGARPGRPPSSSKSWSSWGLTEDIWLIMEDCWKANPTDRPTIDSVLSRLHSDEMYSMEEIEYPLARFRAGALSSSQVMPTRVLDELISNNTAVTGNDDHSSTTHQDSGSDGELLKPYNSENLGRRPRDLRPDYPETFIPRVQRFWSDIAIEGFRDPIRRTINSILDYESGHPHVIYKLWAYPHPQTLSLPILGRIYNYTDLSQLATNPSVDHMRLFHPLLPWYIDVYKTTNEGVTVQDVIMHMYFQLQTQINAKHYLNELGSRTRKRIARAYVRRTQGNDQERGYGIRKVDYLEKRNIFVGLVRRDGIWEIKTRRVSCWWPSTSAYSFRARN
ncbi:hypothetical protein C0989_000280 [Termitomyces sp. Mn162]|nr:hypothetical protein C0989_000280 [Termitomyces sp. Mn162]